MSLIRKCYVGLLALFLSVMIASIAIKMHLLASYNDETYICDEKTIIAHMVSISTSAILAICTLCYIIHVCRRVDTQVIRNTHYIFLFLCLCSIIVSSVMIHYTKKSPKRYAILPDMSTRDAIIIDVDTSEIYSCHPVLLMSLLLINVSELVATVIFPLSLSIIFISELY